MNVAVVGTHYGHIGMMLQDAAQIESLNFVGVAEEDADLGEPWAERLGCSLYTSFEDLLEQETPDLVIAGMHNHEKKAVIDRCVEASCHLVLDKPLGMSIEELNQIAEAVLDRTITLSMYFTLRYTPSYMAVKELVDSGKIGRVVNIISTHPHKLALERRPQSMFHRDTYPGTICDIICHGVDYCRWVTGAEPISVTATHGNAKYPQLAEFEDHAEARFQFSDGSVVYITADWFYPEESPSFGDSRVIVTGTEGVANLRAWAKHEVEVAASGAGTEPVSLSPANYRQFFVDLVEALEQGQDPPISTDDVLRTAYACLVARASADNGGAALGIDVPFATESG